MNEVPGSKVRWLPWLQEGDGGGWDGWMASPTWRTWVWASSGSWLWTGKPEELQSMGLQTAGHKWGIELNWTQLQKNKWCFKPIHFFTNTSFSEVRRNRPKCLAPINCSGQKLGVSRLLKNSTEQGFLNVYIYLSWDAHGMVTSNGMQINMVYF